VGSFKKGKVCWREGRVVRRGGSAWTGAALSDCNSESRVVGRGGGGGSVWTGATLSDCSSSPGIKSHSSSIELCAMLCGLSRC
jgi:hypothetical protein